MTLPKTDTLVAVFAIACLVLLPVMAGLAPAVLNQYVQQYQLIYFSVLAVVVTIAIGWTLRLYKEGRSKAIDREFLLRNRQPLIEQVRHNWIEGVLDQSLHNIARIALGLNEKRAAIETRSLIERPVGPGRAQEGDAVPPGTSAFSLFEQHSRQLLILGAPGAGKTTFLLELARDLLREAKVAQTPDPPPVPVVLSLSSWASSRPPLAEWLAQELNRQHSVHPAIARELVEGGYILPLLDGLDEVAVGYRDQCVQQINGYADNYGLFGLAVCCRSDEYDGIGTKLRMRQAVEVQPMNRDQVCGYLAEAGEPLKGVRQAVEADPTLWELMNTPLMLSIAAIAYQGEPADDFAATQSTEERRSLLFSRYIESMLSRRGPPEVQASAPSQAPSFRNRHQTPTYTHEQTVRWLAWLGAAVKRHGQSDFHLEDLTTDWLPSDGVRQRANYFVWVLAGLLFAVGSLVRDPVIQLVSLLGTGQSIGGVIGLRSLRRRLTHGLVFGVWGMLGGTRALKTKHPVWRAVSLGLVGYLAGWLIFGPGGASSYGLTAMLGVWGSHTRHRPVDTLRWSSQNSLLGLIPGLAIGVLAEAIAGLILYSEPLRLVMGLSYGMGFALVGALLSGLVPGQVASRTGSNQGLRRSVLSAICIMIAATAPFALALLVSWRLGYPANNFPILLTPLAIVYLVGPGIGLLKGGLFSLQHFVIRWQLYRSRAIPWRYVTFLDYAADRILLRKLGGGYIFIHRTLLDHFAALHR